MLLFGFFLICSLVEFWQQSVCLKMSSHTFAVGLLFALIIVQFEYTIKSSSIQLRVEI